jgi:hypothetical protein
MIYNNIHPTYFSPEGVFNMAKKAKRKYTRRKNVIGYNELPKIKNSKVYNPNGDNLGQEVAQDIRASERSSIFIDDCRVRVRELTDTKLLNERGRVSVRIFELRRTLETLENLSYQMSREAEYRKL